MTRKSLDRPPSTLETGTGVRGETVPRRVFGLTPRKSERGRIEVTFWTGCQLDEDLDRRSVEENKGEPQDGRDKNRYLCLTGP